MKLPRSVLLASPEPDQYALVLDSLAGQNIVTRVVKGPLRLAVDFAADPTDVVVLDIESCPQAVFELIEVMRENSPNVGIVIIATAQQRDLAGSALCRGADVLLTKPAASAEMLEAIERADRRRRLAQTELGGGPSAEMLTKFAMGVAHEINNPLTTISGWLQVLISDHAEDNELAQMLKSINEEVDRIADVVRQLLTVAQQTPPRQDKVNVGKMLKELAHYHTVELQDTQTELTTDIDAKRPGVRGDGAQIRQACDTILTEMRAALNGNGKISVSCKAMARGLQIVFEDDGPAIPAESLDRIFDPFEFGRNDYGSGLGLCLSREIIRSHGGTLQVESDEKSGTRFTAWLPIPRT